MNLVAIHQPNFLPWLGFFDKIWRAQTFVVLDDVQFPKSGHGIWTNRVQLLIAGAPAWVTVPIVRAFHGTRLISETEINDATRWREKLLRTIEMNYRRSAYFSAVFQWLAPLIQLDTRSLLDLNLNAIKAILPRLGIDTRKLVLSSTFGGHSHSTDRLIELVRAAGGDAYLAGGGAQGYQEDVRFSESDIALVYQHFEHPTYPQQGASEFVPGLSIVDALMNCGFEGTATLLNRGSS